MALDNGSTSVRPAGPKLPVEDIDWKVWVAVIGATIGAFMAILNIQIVNASLANIEGGIGSGADNGGWISTAYLVPEIIVIPLSAWLARIFSLRVYMLTNSALFLVFSVACAYAQTLPQMIILRAFQGFTGGVLIPMAFNIILTFLPRSKQPIGLTLFGLSNTFAPSFGPTIGGYLTEHYGWQYIFYLNLLPGAVMLVMLWSTLKKAPMHLHLLAKGDWSGIVTMAVGLACLQTVLEEGNKDDWFGSRMIRDLAIVAAISLTVFIWIELRSPRALVNLRLLKRRNFGIGSVTNTLFGMALYGSVFIMPFYLSRNQGYNPEQIGVVMAWSGLPQVLLIPLLPLLMRRFDIRLMCAFGLLLFGVGVFMNTHMNANYAAPQLVWPNIIRAIGQAISFTPLSIIATAGIEPENAGSASALFNMLRNLGGAVGIATLETFETKREQFHSNILNQSVSLFSKNTRHHIAMLTQYFTAHGISDPGRATRMALAAMDATVRNQANIMAFSDTFYLLGVIIVIAMLSTLMLKKAPKPPDGRGGGH
jgi:DHA2 family multidrug resistance protein